MTVLQGGPADASSLQKRYFGVRKARRRGQLEGMVVMSRGKKDSRCSCTEQGVNKVKDGCDIRIKVLGSACPFGHFNSPTHLVDMIHPEEPWPPVTRSCLLRFLSQAYQK